MKISEMKTEELCDLLCEIAEPMERLLRGDINQMINAGFNPLQEIMAMTGETAESLDERLDKHKVSVDEISAAFQHAVAEGGKYHNSILLRALKNSPIPLEDIQKYPDRQTQKRLAASQYLNCLQIQKQLLRQFLTISTR